MPMAMSQRPELLRLAELLPLPPVEAVPARHGGNVLLDLCAWCAVRSLLRCHRCSCLPGVIASLNLITNVITIKSLVTTCV